MAGRSNITDEEIARALEDDDYFPSTEESNSESEDELLMDDVESDFQDEVSDTDEPIRTEEHDNAPSPNQSVGTLRANKREIPEEMRNNRTRPVGTSMFCYDGPLTLLSYKPKPSKMVYLLSSCDENGTINQSSKTRSTSIWFGLSIRLRKCTYKEKKDLWLVFL
ncbi:unnamed protein product [Colias eurytheme]|nr:unnamed protein product [Colias eurytheme]